MAILLAVLAGSVRPMAAWAVDPKQEFEFGEAAFKASKWKEAALSLRTFADRNPNDPNASKALLHAATSHENLRDEGAAMLTWEWIIRRYPASDEAAEALGQEVAVFERKTNPVEAGLRLQKLLSSFPAHPVTKKLALKRFNALVANGNHTGAAALLAPIEKFLTPAEAQKLKAISTLAHADKDPESVIKLADEAIAANKPDQAAPQLEAFLQRAPDSRRASEGQSQTWLVLL